MKVLIDLDGTIANTPVEVLQWFGRRGYQCRRDGADIRVEGVDDAYIGYVFNHIVIPEATARPMVEHWAKIKDVVGSNEIVYLSARPKELSAVTKRWLHKHGFPQGQVLCLGHEGKDLYLEGIEEEAVLFDDNKKYLSFAKNNLRVIILGKERR